MISMSMNKFIMILIIIAPYVVFGSTKHVRSIQPQKISKASLSRLSTMIATFEVTPQEKGLELELSNLNGQKKSEFLTTKTEQYLEYTRYTFANPFLDQESKLDLYIFEKLKPSISDDRDDDSDTDLSEMYVSLIVLIDSATKKTIKSKAQIFYKDSLVGEGTVDNNSKIKISDDLSSKIKNCKLHELKVVRNLLGSDKRSLDFEVGYIQDKRLVKQKMNVSLLNMKQTPIPAPSKDDIENNDLNIKETEDETNSTHS